MAAAAVPAAQVRPARLAGWRYPLAVGVLSRLLAFAIAGTIGLVRREPGQSPGEALLAPLGAWDGIWYQRIADYGYDPTVAHGNGVAFSPLYPLMMRALARLADISYLLAGVLISTACFLAALVLLHRLVARRSGERAARTVVWLTAFFPVAFVFSSAYTESLYLLLTVASFALLEARRFAGACLAGVLVVLTRPTGIMLVPALVLRLWRDRGRRLSAGFLVRVAPVALLPIAYVAFGAYLYYRTGDPFATQSAQSAGWGRGANLLLVLAMPLAVLNGLYVAAHDPGRIGYVVDTACAMLWALVLIEGWVRRRLPPEYLLYGSLAIALPVFAGTYVALPRYGMGVFVVLWLVALHVAVRPRLGRVLRIALPVSMVVAGVLVLGAGVYTP
ncbi:MAG: mannosyltransferase family protein [Gaiellales bacterium]